MIDEEVRALIESGYARATQTLTEHKDRLLNLADKLIAEETVESDEFEKLFADLPPKQNLHGISSGLIAPGAGQMGPGMPGAPAPVPPPTVNPSPNPSPS
jgi:hypothetical protein